MTNEVEQIRKKIGLKIKLERTKRGLSQEQLAALADLSKTYVNAVENGKSSPSADTLIKIAKAFEIELVELIDINKFAL